MTPKGDFSWAETPRGLVNQSLVQLSDLFTTKWEYKGLRDDEFFKHIEAQTGVQSPVNKQMMKRE